MKKSDHKPSDNDLTRANPDLKLCAWCKVTPIPRSTFNKPVPANRKYCDSCLPIAKKYRLEQQHAKERRNNAKKR